MRTVLPLLILASVLAVAPSAVAGGKTPPQDLCLEWESDSTYHQLSIQQNGRIYDKENRIKTYVITGIDQYGIVTGSGYVARGTTILLATYSGMHNGDALSAYQLQYNLTTKSGTIYYRYDTPPDTEPVTGSDRVYHKGCRQLSIPPNQ